MISKRTEEMTSFIVMDVLERANEMEREGVHIVHLEVGEPDFDTPDCVKKAACKALEDGHTHYACYPNFIKFVQGQPVTIPVYEEDGFQYRPESIKEKLTAKTKAIFINSPSNPTGNLLSERRMLEIAALAENRPAPYIVSDEIYHGLVYEGKEHSMVKAISDFPMPIPWII